MEERYLRGSCTCGRNRYVIEIPSPRAISETMVVLDNSSATRRIHASPLTAFLRVPLDWFHSSTYAFYPDEDHTSIRRTYTTPFAPGTRRQFCGYCGTQLSSWSERRIDDADFICLTLGSLLDEDVAILDRMGVLPGTDEEHVRLEGGDDHVHSRTDMSVRSSERQENNNGVEIDVQGRSPSYRHIWTRGSPWFEEMVENSGLAKARRQKAGQVSEDGRTRIEFEILEIEQGSSSDPTSELGRAKRKYEEDFEEQTYHAAGDRDYMMSGALQDD